MADVQQSPRGAMAAEISNGLVSLHHEFYGKGPSKAKTYLVDDTVLCVLNEGFTTVERTLINGGDSGAVHDIRRSFQSAMKEQFTAVVENATGRSVTACSTSGMTIRISKVAKLAPRHRRMPPPKGNHPKAGGTWPTNRSGRNAAGSR